MRRRLKRLGVAPAFCGGDLLAISVEGGGLDVRGRNRRGQVLTGAWLDEQLLAVFPELLPHTLVNLTLNATGTGAGGVGLKNRVSQTMGLGNASLSDSGLEAYNLSLYLTRYEASTVFCESFTGQLSTTAFNFAVVSNTVCTGVFLSATFPPFAASAGTKWLSGSFGVNAQWPAEGVNWVEIHAEEASAQVGTMAWSADVTGNSFAGTIYGWSQKFIRITYTDPPCDTCELTLTVSSACDSAAVGGGEFSLGVSGLSCVPDGGGQCVIPDIPDGTYAWTWTHTGYEPQTGELTCDCAGGPLTLDLSVTPVGGCGGPCELRVCVRNTCDGEPLVGATVYIDDIVRGVTGEDGCLTVPGLDAGPHEVRAEDTGFQPGQTDWDCTPS